MSQNVLDETVGWSAADQPAQSDRDDPAGAPRQVGAERNEPAAKALAGAGIFVTPDGEWICEGSREFFIALGDMDPDYDASSFAVKNLGFIFVQVCPKLFIDIALHPRNTTSVAVSSLQQLLPSIQSNLCRINYLKEHWVSEITSSPGQTICRLSEICALEGVGDILHGITTVNNIAKAGAASFVH